MEFTVAFEDTLHDLTEAPNWSSNHYLPAYHMWRMICNRTKKDNVCLKMDWLKKLGMQAVCKHDLFWTQKSRLFLFSFERLQHLQLTLQVSLPVTKQPSTTAQLCEPLPRIPLIDWVTTCTTRWYTSSQSASLVTNKYRLKSCSFKMALQSLLWEQEA